MRMSAEFSQWVANTRILLLSIFVGVFLLGSIEAGAQEANNLPGIEWTIEIRKPEPVKTGQAESLLISEGVFVPGQTTWFALHQKLAEGWHVYWKNPGDSGLPLVMEWTLPEGFEVGEIEYPRPERIPVGPLVNFGFHHDPIFLIPVTVPEDAIIGEVIEFDVKAEWLICADVCIPEGATFSQSGVVFEESFGFESLDLEQLGIPSDKDVIFRDARAALPSSFQGDALFGAAQDALYLQAELNEENPSDVFFFPEAEGVVVSAADQPVMVKDGKAVLTLKPDFEYDAATIETLAGVLTYVDAVGEHHAYDLTASRNDDKVFATLPQAVAPVGGQTLSGGGNTALAGGGQQAISLPLLLVMAFFGGIILNVMPCVFPILFIKASSLMNSAQEDRATIVRHGWLYTIGVLATFAAIGGLLLILRAQGERLGWGFHLQSPFIVLLSSYVLLLVGLNLAGVFHVGTSVQGVGQGLTSKQGGWGSFFTGALAVLVAAPCIGPLLSAPMGAAVLLPPFWGMMIFMLMAFGLAFPYLLLSLVPGLGRMLPKPGAWMDIFKQLLSFPVFAAAAYFLWVMAAQTGPSGLAVGLIGALLLAAAAWAFELSKSGGTRDWMVRGAAMLLVLGAIIPARGLTPVATTNVTKDGASHGSIAGAIAFDQAKIAELNASGQDVFVDFTAAWCVTCQFNKLTVFSSDAVGEAFVNNNTQLMVADWTVRDEKITAALSAFDRNGVPLYVYYPAGGEPQILELPLTEQAVIKAVSQTVAVNFVE